MKKFSIVLAAAAAMIMASCSGNKQQAAETQEPQQEESFEEQQIKLGMKVRLDSLTQCWLRLKPMAVVQTSKDGKVSLTADEKKVKPDYLLNPDEVLPKLETMSLKYRAICMFDVDKIVAGLYEMPDVYSDPMKKLASQVDDPAINYMFDNMDKEDYSEMMNKVYTMEEESGRANYFWECAATTIIEQLYILTQNQEKFLASFTDKDAEDITFHVSILVDAYEDLAEYNTELAHLYKVICPLEVLNAISVDELRAQLTSLKGDIDSARSTLLL